MRRRESSEVFLLHGVLVGRGSRGTTGVVGRGFGFVP